MSTGIKVFAPATIANVACGFDILGFAIEQPGDEIIAKLSDKPGVHITRITGDGGKLPYEAAHNTAGVAAQKVLDFLGEKRGVEMEIHKKMPFGSGLGSSAASAVAGAFIVNELLKHPLEKRQLLPFAVQGEAIASGSVHADNVAPCLLGGMVLVRDNATLDVHRIPSPKGLYVAVVYPHLSILTKDARAILKSEITLKQHIQQNANLGGLLVGLFRGDIELISRSLQDVIIEPQRALMITGFDDVKEAALESGALGCSISGAGPSVFALCKNTLDAETVGMAMQKAFLQHNINADLYLSPINHEGVRLL